MHNTILSFLMLLLMPLSASAQFYTITKESELIPGSGNRMMKTTGKENDTINNDAQSVRNDTLHIHVATKEKKKGIGQKGDKRTSPKSMPPELTIPTSMRKSCATAYDIRKSYWRRLSLKPDGSPPRYAGTSITCSA